MSLTIQSPYDSTDDCRFRGNLHAHTLNSDGKVSPEMLVEVYRRKGYDWICISDHDRLTPKPETFPEDMTFLPGNEITAGGPHILHVGADAVVPPEPDREAVLRTVSEKQGLAVLNHPNWGKDFNHCPQDRLERLAVHAHGIEVYNADIRGCEGSPLATDRWDLLLTRGIRVWGYANDDAHVETDMGLAWNMVSGPNNEVSSILDGLKNGKFYASTGVVLSTLKTSGNRIRIVSGNGSVCVVITDWGTEIGRYYGRSWEFNLEDLLKETKATYCRFEILGDAGATAWTQPLFLF